MKNLSSAPRRSPYRPLFLAAVCGLLLGAATSTGPLGCSSNQIGGSGTEDMVFGSTGGDGGSGGGGGDGGGQSGYCAGKGPPIVVGDSGSAARCSGQVAASAFRYAMCLCQGLSASSPITVDAFDSTMPGQTTFGNGGSVGVNSNVNAGDLSVGGTLQVAGALTINNRVSAGVDLLLADTLSANVGATVGRNAQINGDVKCNGAAGSLKITGNLTYPSTRTLTATSPIIGSTTRNNVSVAAPCDCAANSIFNIAGYVTERATSNDNAAIGLDAGQLTNFSGDQTLNLTCGRFYLSRIGGAGKLTLNVSGRTALFIGGDVNLTNDFTVNLGASGELDLFINGGLTSSAPLVFGNKDAPARVRLYMGGSRNINLAAGSTIYGNIYAPESALVTSGALTVYGAIFVRSFNPSSSVTIHHDVAILRAADDCTNPGTGGGGTVDMSGGTGGGTSTCSRCQDCGGQACKAGSCGACTTGADCCSPLSCKLGKCVFEVG